MVQEIPSYKIFFSVDKKKLLRGDKEANGKVYIPQGVVEIAEEAFCDCKEIIEFSIPESVKVIGKNAFKGCTALKEVWFEGIDDWCDSDGNKIDAPFFSEASELFVNGSLQLTRIEDEDDEDEEETDEDDEDEDDEIKPAKTDMVSAKPPKPGVPQKTQKAQKSFESLSEKIAKTANDAMSQQARTCKGYSTPPIKLNDLLDD